MAIFLFLFTNKRRFGSHFYLPTDYKLRLLLPRLPYNYYYYYYYLVLDNIFTIRIFMISISTHAYYFDILFAFYSIVHIISINWRFLFFFFYEGESIKTLKSPNTDFNRQENRQYFFDITIKYHNILLYKSISNYYVNTFNYLYFVYMYSSYYYYYYHSNNNSLWKATMCL